MRKLILLFAIAIFGIILGWILTSYLRTPTLEADCIFVPHPLIDASDAQIEQYARNYACGTLQPKGKTQVRLARLMSPQEYISQFGDDHGLCQEQQVVVVLLQGDFGGSWVNFGNFAPELKNTRTKYYTVIFDARNGQPILLGGEMYIGEFRTILNDPTLPRSKFKRQHVPAPEQLPACGNSTEIAPTRMPPQN